jgi:LysM repeat protein/predicted Zn-dependent peptidase
MARARGLRQTLHFDSELTQYVQVVPASELDLALQIDATRLQPLTLPPRVLSLSKRLLASSKPQPDTPDDLGRQRLRRLMFQGSFAYSHAPRGTPSAIRDTPLEVLRELRQRSFRPQGAVLVLVGSLKEDVVRRLTERRLGNVARAPGSAPVSAPVEPRPRQTSERFSTALSSALSTPRVHYGWLTSFGPGASSRRIAAVLTEVLRAPHSALARELSRPKALAENVSVELLGGDGPRALALSFSLAPDATVDAATGAVEKALKELATRGPSADALERAMAELARRSASLPSDPVELSRWLGQRELAPATAGADLAGAVDVSAVRDFVARKLTRARRTTVELYPPKWQQDPVPPIVQRKHEVKPGENLILIARRYGTTVEEIAKANRIRKHRFIYAGQELIVPITRSRALEKPEVYVVRRGDSLSVIAARHGVSTRALAERNGKRRGATIVVGEKLEIPPRGSGSGRSSPSRRKGASQRPRHHRVKKGDTLIGLAKRYRVTPRDIQRANGHRRGRPIYAGEDLVIPPRKKP